MISLILALKYLRPKRAIASVITLLSVIGVMLGVAIVIIVRAVFTGFGDTWEEKILSFKPHVVVTSAHGGSLRRAEMLAERLDQVAGVEAVSASVQTRVLVEANDRVTAPMVIGADAARIQKLLPVEMAQGTFDLSGSSLVIGIDMAQELGCRVGDELLVYSPMNLVKKDEIYFPERLRLTGIYNTGRSDFDSGFIFVSLAIGRDLLGMDGGAGSVSLRVTAPQDSEVFEPIVAEVKRIAGPMCHVQTWQQMDQTLFNALATEKNMMMLLLMFISVVAIFCVVNTLIVITVQKTSEIGLLKALGFSTWQMMLTFVLYGWIQCVVGTLLGIGAAFLVLLNLQKIIDGLGRMGLEVFPKEIYGLDGLPWRVTSGEVFEVCVMVVVLCAAASFIPAWRAAAMDPVTALRDE